MSKSKSEVIEVGGILFNKEKIEEMIYSQTKTNIESARMMRDLLHLNKILQKENEELKDKLKKADQDHYNIAWELEQYKNSNTNKVE